MERNKIIAFESANGFVKVFFNGKHKAYPNTISKAAVESFQKAKGKINPGSKAIYTIGGRDVTAGETLNYITSSSDSIERYGSEHYLRESLIALDQFAHDGDHLTVVTGIPANHYDDKDEATKLITRNLRKTHKYLVNGVEKTLHIKDVLVTLQPLATYFYTIIDEFGNVDETMLERYENTLTLIVDIGWKTTDVAITSGNDLKKWDTLSISMQTAYETLLNELKQVAKDQGKKLATAKVQLMEVERQLRGSDVFKYSNELIDATKVKRDVFTSIAEDIITEADAFRSFDQFTTIIFTGGGTEALEQYLEPHFINQKTGKFNENIFVLNDTQLANVKGYYVFAKYLQD